MNRFHKSVAVTLFSAAVGISLPARADIVIDITDGVHSATADDHTTPGLASYSGGIGNFTVSIDLGTGFPDVGSPSNPILDLTSLDLTTGTAGGTLTISLTETNFTTGPGALQFLSSITGNYSSSVATMNTYLDTTNAHFGTGTVLSSGLVDNQSAIAAASVGAGPFSLTEILTVTAGSNSLTSIDAAITAAPEPGSLPLLAAALLAVGLAGFGLRGAGRTWAKSVGFNQLLKAAQAGWEGLALVAIAPIGE